MKKKLLVLVAAIMLFIGSISATNLVGHVYNAYGYAMVGTSVQLWTGDYYVTSYTDVYGGYYFYNVIPGYYQMKYAGSVWFNCTVGDFSCKHYKM